MCRFEVAFARGSCVAKVFNFMQPAEAAAMTRFFAKVLRAEPRPKVGWLHSVCQFDVQFFPFRRTLMPAAVTSSESARINLRTSPEAKALIERAAAIMGSTVSSFMLQNAYEAARRIVADKDTLMLSQQAFEAFVATCENPPEPTEALRKLMALR
jgi:uncharacterized protein (DUF1778 family)